MAWSLCARCSDFLAEAQKSPTLWEVPSPQRRECLVSQLPLSLGPGVVRFNARKVPGFSSDSNVCSGTPNGRWGGSGDPNPDSAGGADRVSELLQNNEDRGGFAGLSAPLIFLPQLSSRGCFRRPFTVARHWRGSARPQVCTYGPPIARLLPQITTFALNLLPEPVTSDQIVHVSVLPIWLLGHVEKGPDVFC